MPIGPCNLVEQRDAGSIIPNRDGAKTRHAFSKLLYPLRNRIERTFHNLKHFRRIAAHRQKLTGNFLAMIKIAAVRFCLRAFEATS